MTHCQDHILAENIWFAWSKTSNSGDKRRCYQAGRTNNERTTNEQGKIELLSLWAVGRLSFAISHSSYVQKERFNSFVQRIYNIYALQLHIYVRIFDKSGPWVYSVPCLDPFHNLKCCKYVSCNILCLNSLTCENKLVSVQTLR